MGIVECVVRTPELRETVDNLRVSRGWTIEELAKKAEISTGTIHRLYRPDARRGVSKVRYVRLVNVLAATPEQRDHMLELGGVNVDENNPKGAFSQKVNQVVEDLGLNPANKKLLEEFVLGQTRDVGNALKEAQSNQEQLKEDLLTPRRRQIRRAVS